VDGKERVGTFGRGEISVNVHDLIEIIRQADLRHGISREEVENSLRCAWFELGGEYRQPCLEEETQAKLVALVLWKIVGNSETLWIPMRTDEGNPMVPTVLAHAYLMAKTAVERARKFGRDEETVQEILIDAAHKVTDSMAAGAKSGEERKIRNIRRFLYRCYRNALINFAKKEANASPILISQTHQTSELIFSDGGASMQSHHARILVRKLLEAMPRMSRRAVYSRFIRGNSYAEIAEELGSTPEAVRQAVSRGIHWARKELSREGRASRSAMTCASPTRPSAGSFIAGGVVL
jgi:RNA polymerase sigma factor (sigma-70 family)